MDEEEKKRRQEEMARIMRERWAQNAPEFQKGFIDKEENEKKSQWKSLKNLFGG